MQPTRYRITVRGWAPNLVKTALEDLSVFAHSGETVLVGEIQDASHLYGVINRLAELGLELVRLEEVRPDDHPAQLPRQSTGDTLGATADS
jgi:hypothetical protein